MTTPTHDIALDIYPELPDDKALVIVVRGKKCFHRIINADDADIVSPLFAGTDFNVATDLRLTSQHGEV